MGLTLILSPEVTGAALYLGPVFLFAPEAAAVVAELFYAVFCWAPKAAPPLPIRLILLAPEAFVAELLEFVAVLVTRWLLDCLAMTSLEEAFEVALRSGDLPPPSC